MLIQLSAREWNKRYYVIDVVVVVRLCLPGDAQTLALSVVEGNLSSRFLYNCGFKDPFSQQVREEIELTNLANQYIRDMVKKECWDAMVVKGRSVNAFHLSLSVSNYPMKERTKTELEEIEYVTNQRKIEKAEAEACRDVVSGPTSARNTPIVGKRRGRKIADR